MNFVITTLVSQFVNSSLFIKKISQNPSISKKISQSPSKIINISKPLNNSGIKMIQLVKGGLAHHLAKLVPISWLDLFLRLIETFWRASLAQENHFASSTGITAKICNVFGNEIV